MRTITVFSTKGQRKAKIETDVTTWGELKPLVSKEGYDLSSLHATENVNRTDLVNVDAILPVANFTLFLRPAKTKSGVDYSTMGFKELREQLSNEDKDALSASTGKNWTRCSTDDLKAYLSAKKAPKNSSPAVEEVAESANVAEVAEAIAEATNTSRVETIKTLLSAIKSNSSSDEVLDRVDVVLEELEGLEEAIADEDAGETEEEKAEREAKEKQLKAEQEAEEQRKREEAEEDARLEAEAKELSKGF